MKKALVFSAAAALSGLAFAGSDMEKIDTDFDSLDNNDDMKVSLEEADDNNIGNYFADIDSNEDKVLTIEEYRAFITRHPEMVEEGEDLLEDS